jgi:CRISPR-associated protein Cas1
LEASRTASRGDGPHLTLSRAIVDAKCTAMLDLLAQHQRTHGDVDIAFPIARIRAHRERAICASTIDELRGHEGAAAATYFSTMPALCRGDLTTSKRSRRPPRDPINAAISFGYSLLVCEMTTALLARGLDPALGVLHPPEAGRPSLALDLIEPFRHSVVDRLVLRAANRRELTSADFDSEVVQPADPDDATPAPAVRFSDLGRAKFLRMFQAAMCQSDADAGATTGGRAQVSGALAAYESMLEPLLSEPGLMP